VFSIFICAVFILPGAGREFVRIRLIRFNELRSTACLRRIISFYIDNTNIGIFLVLCNTKYQPKKGNFHKKITGFDQKPVQIRVSAKIASRKKPDGIVQMV